MRALPACDRPRVASAYDDGGVPSAGDFLPPRTLRTPREEIDGSGAQSTPAAAVKEAPAPPLLFSVSSVFSVANPENVRRHSRPARPPIRRPRRALA